MAKNERRNLRTHLRAIDLLFPRARNEGNRRGLRVARIDSFRFATGFEHFSFFLFSFLFVTGKPSRRDRPYRAKKRERVRNEITISPLSFNVLIVSDIVFWRFEISRKDIDFETNGTLRGKTTSLAVTIGNARIESRYRFYDSRFPILVFSNSNID